MVEVAENHRQALVHRSESVRERYADVVEGNVGSASGRRIGRLDRLCLNVVVWRHENDRQTFLSGVKWR